MNRKLYLFVIVLIFIFSCSSNKKNITKEIKEKKEFKINKIKKIDGYIKFSKNSTKFLKYNGKSISVYNGDDLIIQKELKKAGKFRWSFDGEKIYFIKYSNFIRDHHRMNSGMLKILNLKTNKIENVIENNYISSFDILNPEEMVVIRLGSLLYLEKSEDGYNIDKLINGNCLNAFIFNDVIAVYRRKNSEKLIFIDKSGDVEFSYMIKEKYDSVWAPSYSFEKNPNHLLLFLEDDIKKFVIHGNNISIKKYDDQESVIKKIKAGDSQFFWEIDGKEIFFYIKKNYESKKYLYKLENVIPMSFHKIDNFLFFRWNEGVLIFKLDLI